MESILIGARFFQYAGASVLWGSPLFFLYGMHAGGASVHLPRSSWETRLTITAGLTTLIGAMVWVMAETASMSDQASDAMAPSALWAVMSQTRFGFASLVRIALLVLALVISVRVRRAKMLWTLEAALGGAISLSFAWTGHGASDIWRTQGLQVVADLLHILAAGVWVGALVPLSILVLRASRSSRPYAAQTLRTALQAFSSIGIWVVAVLVLSGVIKSVSLLDLNDWRMSLSTLYARVLLVKLTLFVGMLGLAAFNRYHTPMLAIALDRPTALTGALSRIRSSLVVETTLATLVLSAVSWLGALAPPVSQMR